MLKIHGVNIFPSQIESVLMDIKEVGPHYQILLKKHGFMDGIEVKVELLDSSLLESFKELESLEKRVRARLRIVLSIDVPVHLVEPKSIERTAGKALRVVDLRGKD